MAGRAVVAARSSRRGSAGRGEPAAVPASTRGCGRPVDNGPVRVSNP